jgi:hypothetical protein
MDPNDLIARARSRIAEINQELETLKIFVDSAERAMPLLDAHSSHKELLAAPSHHESVNVVNGDTAGEVLPTQIKRTRVTDNPRPAVLIPVAVEILRKNGHPMSRRELWEALAGRGLLVKGADPIKALGTILWRAQDQIVQVEGFGYWPKADPYMPGKYWGLAHDLLG